jgi:hypothetical protein
MKAVATFAFHVEANAAGSDRELPGGPVASRPTTDDRQQHPEGYPPVNIPDIDFTRIRSLGPGG